MHSKDHVELLLANAIKAMEGDPELFTHIEDREPSEVERVMRAGRSLAVAVEQVRLDVSLTLACLLRIRETLRLSQLVSSDAGPSVSALHDQLGRAFVELDDAERMLTRARRAARELEHYGEIPF